MASARSTSPVPPFRATLLVVLCGLAAGLLAPDLATAGRKGPEIRRAILETPANRRVVAVGDIHGARGALVALLRSAGLIDEVERWSGGDAILVQTGDFLDRGESAVEVALLLRRLQEEAPKDGGEVLVLLGNHEMLNLVHRWDDITPRIVAAFASEDSEERREEYCTAEARRRRREARERRDQVPSKIVAFNRCIREHPIGKIEYVEALEPESELGGWLRSLPAVARVGDTVFVHGGITAELAELGIEELNDRVHEEIETFDQARRWMLDRGFLLETDPLDRIVLTARGLARSSSPRIPPQVLEVARFQDWLTARPEGVLWFRGYAEWEEAEGRRRMGEILAALDAERIVSGHTTHPGETRIRFGGRSALIDTGMLTAVYRGLPIALEIEPAGCLAALHLDGRRPLWGCELRQPVEWHAEETGSAPVGGGGRHD